MNILICHERFLFRFGADRVLILLGKGLSEQGHAVGVLANRYDPEIVGTFASRIIDCPVEGAYLDLNEFTVEWLGNSWDRLFSPGNTPDVVIVGGWPFISAITFFREVCQQVIFIDFGVVPTYGYPEGAVATLEKLRALRRKHLQNTTLIASISRFIAESQSRPDSGNTVPVRPILLGADHMEMTVWAAAQLKLGAPHGSALNLVRSLKLQSKKVILCLGRWEPGCYKNSQAALDVMVKLADIHPGCTLVVLEQAANVEVPAHLKNTVLPIGFPDDQELIQIIKEADLGISLSLWEGFNLPLAELQWLGRPALAFDRGAHREVVAHPWYLCQDAAEMSLKAAELLAGRGPDSAMVTKCLEKFRAYFRWERFINDYSEILTGTRSTEAGRVARIPRTLLIDVTNSTRDIANSGVVRVTRRLSRELQRHGEDPLSVVWEQNTGRYILPTRAEYAVLSQFNGPLLKDVNRLSRSSEQPTPLDEILSGLESPERWLLLPELMMEVPFRHARQFARERNMKIAAIFYDSIPILRPDLCNEQVRGNHRQYMSGLAECDLVIPISHFSARCLEEFWRESRIATSCRVVPDVLPGEFGGSGRNKSLEFSEPGDAHILCVSTLEPRKNHRNLIQACLWMAEKYPKLQWTLTLVGNLYDGALEIADWVREISAKDPRIQWLGIVDDATLDRLYRESLFTVYPSVIEGFGLPILESIWYGRPCICYDQGVMAELADGGGCLTTDVTNPIRLSEAIYALASDRDLRLKLSREAIARPLKTWDDYVFELTEAMAQHARPGTTSERTAITIPGDQTPSLLWEGALYPDCLCRNWQMNDSERMALTGLLARHNPGCSIEVGTYGGGSLSLISQYSRVVFSIDIDETIPSRFSFPNVSFLTGRSTVILPHLFRELERAEIPVEFILIDGDHSAAGVISDIACLLAYVPRRPLFVALHDSFNPECRRGMLEAAWEKSPYCHWVDIDFVPGRIVEHAGAFNGELWGGLAAAYFHPVARRGELRINRSANEMFQLLSAERATPAGAQA